MVGERGNRKANTGARPRGSSLLIEIGSDHCRSPFDLVLGIYIWKDAALSRFKCLAYFRALSDQTTPSDCWTSCGVEMSDGQATYGLLAVV